MALKGEKNPKRVRQNIAKIEFIASFDEIKKLFEAGHDASMMYRKLSGEGKFTMSHRTFQRLCQRHLKEGVPFNRIHKLSKKKKLTAVMPASIAPMLLEKPFPPPPSGGVKADDGRIETIRPRTNRYTKDE